MRQTLLLMTALLATNALAWVPKLDETSAKAVIDSAYNRRAQPVRTFQTIDLSLKEGYFAAGPDTVKVFDGAEECLRHWTQDPQDYARHGSRPTSITLTGQADDLFLRAQQARNEFKNLTVQDALKPREGQLPDGHLRVYVSMTGLESEHLRDAYMIALRTRDGQIVQPYRRAFTNDWKQDVPTTGTATHNQTGATAPANRWSGTMVYYFDAAGAGIATNAKPDVLIRTEADANCAYAVPVDLGSFH